jgi:hypothetical protein
LPFDLLVKGFGLPEKEMLSGLKGEGVKIEEVIERKV